MAVDLAEQSSGSHADLLSPADNSESAVLCLGSSRADRFCLQVPVVKSLDVPAASPALIWLENHNQVEFRLN